MVSLKLFGIYFPTGCLMACLGLLWFCVKLVNKQRNYQVAQTQDSCHLHSHACEERAGMECLHLNPGVRAFELQGRLTKCQGPNVAEAEFELGRS